MMANVEFFVAHYVVPWADYVPDTAALREASTRIVVAGGSESSGQMPYLCAAAPAERLGSQVVAFPGAHGGFLSHPSAFAARLARVLGGR